MITISLLSTLQKIKRIAEHINKTSTTLDKILEYFYYHTQSEHHTKITAYVI